VRLEHDVERRPQLRRPHVRGLDGAAVGNLGHQRLHA
jgi:hypothetical protein